MRERSASAPAPSVGAPSAFPSEEPGTISPDVVDPLPNHTLVAKRELQPTEEVAFCYQEYAYAVAPGLDLAQVERLLWGKSREIIAALESTPGRKFIQLAAFDHSFTDAPERAPLAVLIWKDWRGAPTLAFPSEPSRVSQWPFGAVSVPAVSVPPASRLPKVEGPAATEAPVPGVAVAAPVIHAQALAPVIHAQPRDPVADLVSDLFDTMHELSYQRGVTEGAEFVLGVTSKLIPVKYCLVHVFDINANEFVLVRASGERHERALLSRISDREPWVVGAMRRDAPTLLTDAGGQARWQVLEFAPSKVVLVPVRLGGRYLGLLELADPADGGEFFENELNALSYIGERFAQFLADRPIVLDAEVVLSQPPPKR
ncbi:MAG: hypothetical protein SFV15_21310 [Polyangiaceae bacterium]|nr:hypothetical protein [Polyangiaceae bacterium]